MKHLRKENLPNKVVEKLGLDEMAEVFWSEERGKYLSADNKPMSSLDFAGVDLVSIDYTAKVEWVLFSNLLNDSPYHLTPQELISFSTNIDRKPHHTTHYSLGQKKRYQRVEGEGRHVEGIIRDVFPIVYLSHHSFIPLNKE